MSTPVVSASLEGRRKAALRSPRNRQWLVALLFLLPAVAVYVVFMIYPMIRSLFGSLWSWRGLRPQEFVGLDNFFRLFEGQNATTVGNAFIHNTFWFVGVLVVQNLLGLIIAYILYTRGARFTFFQNWFFFPAILSPVLVGALWKLLLAPRGPVDSTLNGLGVVDEPITWLGDSNLALGILIAVDIWNWVGMPILVFLAGFNALNPEIFEAARLDGSNAPRVLFQIAFPLLIPSVTSMAVLSFINSFNQFDLVYVMQGVQGSPNFATDTLVTFFYRLAFGAQGSVGITDVGLSLALGALLFLFLIVVAGASMRFFNRRAEAVL